MRIKYNIFIAFALVAMLAVGCNKTTNNTTSNSGESNNGESNQGSQNSFQNITPNQHNVVIYTGSGFSPSTITIKQGDTVAFENKASDNVRIASNPHPIHNGYPTTGGCVSSTFDSCGNIPPGQMWLFKFDIAGSWGYHNHLNPSQGGTVVVQPASH